MHRIVDRLRAALPWLTGQGGRRAGRSIELADLLGRPAVNLDTPQMQRFLAGKRVLVTGAGGSIGSEICRQTMRFCPDRLLLVERAENNLFEIDRELRQVWMGADIRPYVADVCDAIRIRQVFEAERPQVIFHCAAHKHVPMMEANPCEAIKNNVFGTRMVADAAAEARAAALVLVSTDKAVNPTSVMGATKRVAELYVQSLNAAAPPTAATRAAATTAHPTRFVAVRFGNVLGSSGSVVPIFQRQIEAGGPVTVTHPDMQRYFMTIPEASQLVMQAGALAQGGEIFVLDMGSPVKIVDLARELIRRNGLRVGQDIEVRFTGIRPGEKLFEELAAHNEETRPTAHPKIRVWQLPQAGAREIGRVLEMLARVAATGDAAQAMAALARCVPEYRPSAETRDMSSEPAIIGATPPARPALRLVQPDAAAEAA